VVIADLALSLAGADPDLAAGESGGSTAAPEGLLRPTDASRCVTSSFCEFRSGHFHAGIDISTNGITGFRCFAVGDGDVVRVRVGCRGYGKAVYLRLRDGRTAVYAHLDHFAGAIEDSARAHGRRTGSAYFDRVFAPGTFPVRRGDVIAFSGETGVGVPHLHLEIRDAEERPLDPLRAGLLVDDDRAPRIRRIALTPA
jgi:murein DD-endopeptidase MepM/ murein hydrolase activator NlpD